MPSNPPPSSSSFPVSGLVTPGLVTQSLAKQIAERIRQAIVDGSLRPDQRLPTEETLAEQFSVSRPTVREGLKRLAAQNLVRSRRGPSGGTFICRPSVIEASRHLSDLASMLVSLDAFSFEDILSARRDLERLCARHACLRRRQEHLDGLERELARQRRSTLSDEDFCASDVAFHRLVVDAAGEPVLSFLMHAVIEALQPISNMVVVRVRDRQRTVEDHQRLLDAIAREDEAAAEQAIDTIIETLRSHYQAIRERPHSVRPGE